MRVYRTFHAGFLILFSSLLPEIFAADAKYYLPRQGYIRPGREPFLEGIDCLPGQDFQEDPQFCDRGLFCPRKGPKYVVYCPQGYVFGPERDGSCIPLDEGKLYCESRYVREFQTKEKPIGRCNAESPKDSYRPLANRQYEHAFFMCRPGFNEAHVIECHHPFRPKILPEESKDIKCYSEDYKTYQARNETNYIRYKSLPIKFIDNTIVCPTKIELLKWYKITAATRYKDINCCKYFWTCGINEVAMKIPCEETQVFDPRSETCIFYKHAEPPCNTFYDNEDPKMIENTKKLLEDQENDQQKDMIRTQISYAERELARLKQELIAYAPGTYHYVKAFENIIGMKEAIKKHEMNLEMLKDRSRSKRSAGPQIITPLKSAGIIFPGRIYNLEELEKVDLDENLKWTCPPVKLNDGITDEAVRRFSKGHHFNSNLFYDMSPFRSGIQSRFYMGHEGFDLMARCSSFFVCGPQEHYENENRPSISYCPANTAFQRLQLKAIGVNKFMPVVNTGMCRPIETVKGCEKYISPYPVIKAPVAAPVKTSDEMLNAVHEDATKRLAELVKEKNKELPETDPDYIDEIVLQNEELSKDPGDQDYDSEDFESEVPKDGFFDQYK